MLDTPCALLFYLSDKKVKGGTSAIPHEGVNQGFLHFCRQKQKPAAVPRTASTTSVATQTPILFEVSKSIFDET